MQEPGQESGRLQGPVGAAGRETVVMKQTFTAETASVGYFSTHSVASAGGSVMGRTSRRQKQRIATDDEKKQD